ncbi:MAG TPA: Xaa-Pro peptidase family protein [Chthoniobacteraceae bacterium]|nr:Xaa-Pro peptidase family protein [Chthoniobacteraceae bacterium]
MKNRLIVAASETDPDLLYATRFFAPDPFVWLEKKGRTLVMLNDLEIDRGRQQAQVDEVVPQSEVARRAGLGERASFGECLLALLKQQRVRSAVVPAGFPFGLAAELMKGGIALEPLPGLFFPEREFKNAEELRAMRRALAITEAGMGRAMEVLSAATIGPRKRLQWGGRALTSERLRAEIDSAVLHAGGQPANTIVAGGNQACDPHERGHGPLLADSLIVLDIFPRDAKSGYYGDMTRTVVRGRASDAQRQLWETVLEAQQAVIRKMKPGADGEAIHRDVVGFFRERGYPTRQENGRWTGFFHGTGHGLGLEIHEPPRFARTRMKPGQVITVEPGLYYPGLGGVRIEDVATITESGARLLSRFEKRLEL